MRPGHPQICLYQPDIPQNTGAIGRLVAGACSRLHLVTPLGFSMTEKDLRRPGLDYWPFLDLEIHHDFEALLSQVGHSVALLTKFATRSYTEIPTNTKLIVFGKETTGLPKELRERFAGHCYKIPMYHEGVRSLNLANAVSIVLYDQLARRLTIAK